MTVIEPIPDPRRRVENATSATANPTSRDIPMLAHDIRGALQGVIGGVIALEQQDPPDEVAEQVARISTATRSLDHLVGLLLGDGEEACGPAPVGVDLRTFAAYLRQRWTGEAHDAGFDFSVEVAADAPGRILVHRMSLARAVGNLVRNAITHGGGGVWVTARSAPDGGLLLEVRDRGAGLPEAARASLAAEAPPMTSGARAHGLGLRIVQAICAETGARLRLDNPADGGLLATIELPPALVASAGPDPSPAPAARQETPARDPEPSGLRGARILLAEDNPTNQMVANQMLRALDAEVTISSDGVEALEAFELAEYDLVVVDIEMPRMSGLDVIRAIRGRADERADVPIVALTAYALREHRDRIAEAGANGLISKPITSIEALGRELASHLRHRTARSEVVQAATHEPEEAAGDPAVDMEVYRALCEAIGVDMMSELLEKVIGDLEELRRELAAAIDPLDLAPIRSVSHILISVAGAIGAKRLQHGARDLNRAAHDEADGIAAGARAVLDEIDAAIDFVRVERAAAGRKE